MIIDVPNRPPKFINDLESFNPITVPINSIYIHPIPDFYDPD